MIENKIADFIITDGAGQDLVVASTVDEFPLTKIFEVNVSLFNVDLRLQYSLKVTRDNITLNRSKINLNRNNLSYNIDENIGKTAVMAPITLVIEEPGDFSITVELHEDSKIVDSMTKYFTFAGVENA